MKISQSIPSLFNGVSQQSPSIRLPSQGDIQINGYSSLVDGLIKRPPSNHLAKLMNKPTNSNIKVHVIDRDPTERYVAVFADNDLKMFDLFDGSECTVSGTSSSYINSTTPRDSFKCMTVADYTFVLNTDTTTGFNQSETPETVPNEAYVYVKTGLASMEYIITVSGSVSGETECKKTTTTTPSSYTTTKIAEDLHALVDAVSDMDCELYGSLLKITCSGGANNFGFATSDGYGDTALIGLKGTAGSIVSLPPTCWDGVKLLITGSKSDADDYFVEFAVSDGTSKVGNGTWQETRGYTTNNQFDATTMPHKIVRNADGTFTFGTIDWGDREVGSNDSSPPPSFIGNQLKDIFFFRNRLGFLCDENVILSRAASYFDFWYESVMTSLDSDMIDISSNHIKVAILEHAIPYNQQLIIFSSHSQFSLDADDELTPLTARLDVLTEFENEPTVVPVGAGSYLFFAMVRGDYTAIREYFVDEDNITKDAADITAHVPTYIPHNCFKIEAMSSEDCLFIQSTDTPNKVYVYKYYWSGTEKLQSSWSTWTFDSSDNILDISSIGSTAYLTTMRDDGIYLDYLNLSSGNTDGNLTFDINLDRKTTLSGVYTLASGTTTWDLPYADDSTDYQIILGPTFSGSEGLALTGLTRPTLSGITATGDYSSGDCFIGKDYTFQYRLSPQYVKKDNQSILEGRLQLQRLTLNFTHSGYFYVEITPKALNSYTYDYTHNLKIGTTEALIGTTYVADGTFNIPILSRADLVDIDIYNSGYFPVQLQSCEWEGLYVALSRRN